MAKVTINLASYLRYGEKSTIPEIKKGGGKVRKAERDGGSKKGERGKKSE